MFIKLSKLISSLRGGKQPKPQTFDLSDADITSLRVLCAMNEWHVYVKLIDNVVEYRGEALLATRANADLHFLRGQIAALRELPLLVERMTKAQKDANERPKLADRAGQHAARRGAALYATPSWPA